MIDGELVSLGPNKPFQTPKHHSLLSVLMLGSGQPVQRSQLLCLWGGVLRACSIIHSLEGHWRPTLRGLPVFPIDVSHSFPLSRYP